MTKIRKGQISSSGAGDGDVLTADGAGGADWETPSGGPGAVAFSDLTDTFAAYTGLGGQYVKVKSTEDGLETGSPAGSGDVVGPSSATDGHLAVFDGTSGKLLKDGGAVSAGGGNVTITFDESTKTEGADQNRNTSATFAYLAQRVMVSRILILDAVLWDIRIAGDYTLTIRDMSNNILYTVAVTGVLAGSADVAFDLSPDVVLQPGCYWFRLTVSGAAVSWSDYNSANDEYRSAFGLVSPCDYGGTLYNYRAPLKLRYYDSTMTVS